jgi:ABC-type amino acid transport substrate-binding protein
MKTAILFLFSLIFITTHGQTVRLKLASDVWPPFTDVKTEKSVATDLVKEALSRIDIGTDLSILDFKEVISGIDDKKFDGSAALWLSPEREEKYIFSAPYLHNQLILVGLKGRDVGQSSLIELHHKKIGVVENYAYGTEGQSIGVDFVAGESDQQNLERLLSGTIDYMLVDALLIEYLLKYQVNDVSEFLEIGESPILTKSLHFAIRNDVDGGEEIISGFNDKLLEMVADGTYNRILELNWIRADVDGDGQAELILEGDIAGTEPPMSAYGVYPHKSLVEKSSDMNRFYVNGKIYNDWNDIPDEFKKEIVMSTQSVENSGIKLDF